MIDDLPKTKKYDTKRTKLESDLQKLKDERKYYARIFNKHITRQTEIDNMPSEDEEEESKSKPFLTEARKRRLKQQLEQQKKDEEKIIKQLKK